MKMIFVPQKPNNVIDVTTNSSSEIFVFGTDENMEAVNKIIDEGGWRWWFGEMKTIETNEDVMQFLDKYGHVLDTVCPHIHPNRVRNYEDWVSSQRRYGRYYGDINSKHNMPDYLVPSYRMEKLIEKYEQKMRGMISDVEKEKIEKKRWKVYHAKWDKENQLEEEWAKSINPQLLIGMRYFACGEDNELHDWEQVHDFVPGKYARLS